MQALEWAILYPDQVDAVVAIASTHALHPQGVAWNAIAREAIMRDPAWHAGHYHETGDSPDAGMGVARMIGHITYLSAPALSDYHIYARRGSSDHRPLAEKYLPRGAGAVFSFDCAGGRRGGQDLIRGVTLWSHLANVGDAKSLIIHPASTTHRQLSDEELAAAGVGPGTVRLSVGTESVDDLIWDLEQGLARVR